MKKMFFAVLFLFPLLLACTAGIREPAANPETNTKPETNANPETDFEWRVNNDGGVSIRKYVGESLDVVIPEKIQGYPVLQIGDNAFREKNLQSVKLPKTLTHIGERAFYENELRSIVIPEGVIAMGDGAFRRNHLWSVTLPGTLPDINEGVFSGNRIQSIVIPEGIKKIASSAFAGNIISSVSLPRSLTHLDEGAFLYNNLRELTLPENLEYIGSMVFVGNEISRVTIYSENLRIDTSALTNNPIVTVDLHTKAFPLLPQRRIFHPTLPGYLPPGTYILGEDKTWFVQNADGALLSIQSDYEKLAREDANALERMTYDAIKNHDTELLRSCLSWGLNVNAKIFDSISPNGNTPLAQALYYDSNGSPPRAKQFTLFNAEIIQILLEAGAVPQYWMLHVSYFHADITKMLLDYGALTNPESSEHGDPPSYYQRPESLILHYCLKVGEIPKGNWDDALSIAESVTVLLEYGLDANYRDPQSGQTPLTVALNSTPYSPDLVDSLLRYVSRPLSRNDYRRLIEFNTGLFRRLYQNQISSRRLYQISFDIPYDTIYLWESWLHRVAKSGIDNIDYDTLVLSDIRQGILNPHSKDDDGKDIFDYAATAGTAVFMNGLVPWLIESGRAIVAPDETGLYFDALNAGNSAAASVLSTVMDNAFTGKDADGNEYLLEYYAYDYDTIYDSAQRIPEYSLYQTGPDGASPVGISSGGVNPDSRSEFSIHYRTNEFYAIKHDHSDLLLRTAKGAILNLSEIINKKREQKPDNGNPECHVLGIFGNMLFVCNTPYRNEEYFLVDISSAVPSVYILDKDIFDTRSEAMDFVFGQNRDKAYSIKRSGEVLVFNVEADTLQLEQTVSWRDCRISGWKDGERVFIDGETLEAYNFATGTARTLGTHIETPRGLARSYYLYEDEQGRRFIVEAKTGRVYPEPDVEYYGLSFFESGYAYRDEKYRNITLCYVEATRPEDTSRPLDARLKRKLVLSGNVIDGPLSWNVDRGKMYFQAPLLVFTVDLRTGQVNRAFNTQPSYSNNAIIIYMFPFGTDDIVYTETHDGGK